MDNTFPIQTFKETGATRPVEPTHSVRPDGATGMRRPKAQEPKIPVIPKEPAFPDLVLEFCSREDSRYKKIRDQHYVENRGAHAQQVHFLIWYKNQLAGIISGGSSTYGTKPRDVFFGITRENRGKVLNAIINNTVFRLVNNEPNLGTRVLSLWRKVVADVWEALYGVVPFGFETFVVEEDRRKGMLYASDNWTATGRTDGSAKSHRGLTERSTRKSVVPKLVFVKWRDGFSSVMESEYKSSWRGKTPVEKRRARAIAARRRYLNGRIFYIRRYPNFNRVCFT